MTVKTLIIPDLHLKWEKADTIIKHVAADNIVFLGDFFDDFGDDYRDNLIMAEWLAASLAQRNRIHLMGNHDANYAFGHRSYKCSGYDVDKDYAINGVLKEPDWRKLPLYTWVGSWLCTHAGLHTHFYDKYGDGKPVKSWLKETCDIALNTAFENKPAVQILRAGYDRGGNEMYGGIYWCDVDEFKGISGVNQIFGHSPQRTPKWVNIKSSDNLCLDVGNGNYYAIYNSKTDALKTYWIGDI